MQRNYKELIFSHLKIISLLSDLLQPGVDQLEGGGAGDGVDQQEGVARAGAVTLARLVKALELWMNIR